jgi:hypothetical protein
MLPAASQEELHHFVKLAALLACDMEGVIEPGAAFLRVEAAAKKIVIEAATLRRRVESLEGGEELTAARKRIETLEAELSMAKSGLRRGADLKAS